MRQKMEATLKSWLSVVSRSNKSGRKAESYTLSVVIQYSRNYVAGEKAIRQFLIDMVFLFRV